MNLLQPRTHSLGPRLTPLKKRGRSGESLGPRLSYQGLPSQLSSQPLKIVCVFFFPRLRKKAVREGLGTRLNLLCMKRFKVCYKYMYMYSH